MEKKIEYKIDENEKNRIIIIQNNYIEELEKQVKNLEKFLDQAYEENEELRRGNPFPY